MPKKQKKSQKKARNTTSSVQPSPTKQSAMPIKYKYYCPYCWCFFRKIATLQKHLENNHHFWYEKIAERKWGTLYRRFVVSHGVEGPWKKWWLRKVLQQRACFIQTLKIPIERKQKKVIKNKKRPITRKKQDKTKQKRKNQKKYDTNVAKSPSKANAVENQKINHNNGDVIDLISESNRVSQDQIDESRDI